jgi:hypothetical protein
VILRAVAALLVLAIAAACVQSWRLHSLQSAVAAERAHWVQTELDRVKQVTELHDAINRQAQQRTASTRRDLSAAVVAGDGLRDRTATTRAVGASAAAGCPDAARAIDLLADVPGRLDPAGRAVAEYADSLATALNACQRAYAGDGVTK